MKKLFVGILVGVLFFSNYLPVFAQNNNTTEMKIVDIKYLNLNPTEANAIPIGDMVDLYNQTQRLQINIDGNEISGKYINGLGFGTENEAITVDANIIAKIDSSGKIKGKITGRGRTYDAFYGGGAGEWTNNLCRPYGPKKFPDFHVEGTYDFATKIIKLNFDNCGLINVTFASTQPVDLVSCESDEVYLDEKCVAISKLCSTDENVNYNVAEKKCYCPAGYKLTDQKTCEEVEEMLFEVSYPEQQPPFLMDGAEHKIKVSVKNGETNEPMKATRLAIKYTSAPKQGEITNIQEISVGEYLLTYKTAVIEAGNMNGWMDGLYIFYNSKLEGKEIYKTYEIPLGTGVPVKIKKIGFQETTSAIVFAEDSAQVQVFVKNKKGEKIPVRNASVVLDKEIVGEKTNAEGIATLQSPEEITSDTKQEILEVVLIPTEEISQRQAKALRQYKQIIQGDDPLASPEVRNFVEDFPSYLAQLDDDEYEVEKALIGLKRVAYTLLYMIEGKNLTNDISANVAGSLKNQVTDTLDLIGASEKASKFLGQKIDEKVEMSTLQQLAPSINKKLDSLGAMFQEKTINTIKLGIKKYAPSFKTERTNDLLGAVFGNYGRDDMLQKGIEEIQKAPIEKVEKIIKEYLMEEFDTMLVKKMNELEEMIAKKRFSTAGFEEDISISKLESLNLRDKYMTAHEVSYDIAMTKNRADLINSTIIETMKITQVYKKQAEIAEKGYKAIRSLYLNNKEIYYRVDAYGEFISEVEKNVDRGIGIAYIPIQKKSLRAQAYATEDEFSEEQFADAAAYRGADSLIEIQDVLLAVNTMLLKVYPDDPELLMIQEELESNKLDEQKLQEDLGEQAAINAKLVAKKLGSDYASDSERDIRSWIALGLILALIAVIIFTIRLIIKKIKKTKVSK